MIDHTAPIDGSGSALRRYGPVTGEEDAIWRHGLVALARERPAWAVEREV